MKDSMDRIAVLFPGQGSQYVGMGADLHRNCREVQELFDEASSILGMDMKRLCFSGPNETLRETANAQPAVTLVNAACFTVLKKEGICPYSAAGHSLGEYAALYAAGSVGFRDLMELVRLRGIFMQEAAQGNPGGMLAVIGLGLEKIRDVCGETAVEIANYNSPGQTVLTGEARPLEEAAKLAKKAGAKLLVPLKVSGPWHSHLMQRASEKMAEALKTRDIAPPSIPVVANLTAKCERDPEAIKKNLVGQITSPVMWTDSVERLVNDGHTLFVEAGPGKVLKGLMREIDRNIRAFNVEDMDTLKKMRSEFAGKD
ncbi:MAG: ACP S-malonyltransferase [Deltaproteobacteria bacterium]|nr:ACP S-malonyltransferase [Deltaproteobacteria bacterium]